MRSSGARAQTKVGLRPQIAPQSFAVYYMDITVYFARIDNFTMCTAAVKNVSRNARSTNGTRAADKKKYL